MKNFCKFLFHIEKIGHFLSFLAKKRLILTVTDFNDLVNIISKKLKKKKKQKQKQNKKQNKNKKQKQKTKKLQKALHLSLKHVSHNTLVKFHGIWTTEV